MRTSKSGIVQVFEPCAPWCPHCGAVKGFCRIVAAERQYECCECGQPYVTWTEAIVTHHVRPGRLLPEVHDD